MDTSDLKQPELYINRELSLLEFNWRVLEQAKDDSIPLLERLRYLCISTTNLDEFFEVRVAALIQRAQLGSTQAGPDNMMPQEILNAISTRSHEIVTEQYNVLNNMMFPLLKKQNVRFIRRAEWNNSQEKWLYSYFQEELLPILSPLGLDPAHPFPRILNKSLNFIVQLTGKDAFGRNSGLAIVQAPRALPRVIQLPKDETQSGSHDFVFLSSIIHSYANELFHGMKIKGCYQFRVTRNSNLFVDEEEVGDLLRAVEGELASRRYGDAVRLEIAHNCPDNLVKFLLDRFEITEKELFQVEGPVNLNRTQAVYDLIDKPDLKFPSFTPSIPQELLRSSDIFNVIKKGDILLHHPFQSFAPVLDFIRQASTDPNVLSIKQTLYRTGAQSTIVDHLVEAARAGKEVTVVVELRARFDEAANIELATKLQEAGVHVVYGIVGYKTHAKMVHIVRRENKRLRQYVHLGTGNYHARTARLYTDYGLLTCDKQIGKDIHNVFLQLTSLGKVAKLDKILQSPFTLHNELLNKIEQEISFATKGRPARIIVKVNALTERQVIHGLYRASIAGVKIDLIIRGICDLRPGIPGVSDNIQVRSIVGRFLEHTRVYYFENDGKPEVYAASADWMSRNLMQRVETCFPLQSVALRDRVIKDINYYLKDNKQAWQLHNDGTYRRITADGEELFSAQAMLLEKLAQNS
ncbi:MAG: polyphosphate kinase 1 [Gammaproteobacteria bacterium]|nr:polyphosphate kinase 1 [Gammaproteobacteria bacterium]